ncbi:AAA domain-containing protein [Lactarius hatsudake]|nr:AAA domain-containing protein [Lactarius hatsudake]
MSPLPPPPGASTSAIDVPTYDPSFTVSHESGLDFIVEGTENAGRHSFPPVSLAILIEETEVVSRLSIPTVKLFPAPGTPESCMQLSDRKFVILRELRGRATLPGSHVGDPHPREPFPRSNLVDDDATLSTEEREILPDSQSTGISVSDEEGVNFGIVERNGLNGPFGAPSFSVTIDHAKGFPAVTFVEARIRSWDGSDSRGRSRIILPGMKKTVQIKFIPEFEGQFEATLQLIFSVSRQSGQFAVSRRLRAIAGSVEDHNRFEFLDQETYIPRSGSSRQIPPEKIIPLSNPARRLGNIPEYELPPMVQEAVDSTTNIDAYNNKAPHLIATLRPTELAMGTYAEFFTALLNVEEGHQLRDILDQRPSEVEVQKEDSGYFIEFENLDEDLLPEALLGDFLWGEDRQDDVYYDTRITKASVFTRRHLAVLKICLQAQSRRREQSFLITKSSLSTQARRIVELQQARRSHGAIIAWPNRYLYEDSMHAHAIPDVSHFLLQSDVLPKQGFPVVFHGIKGRELRARHSPSFLNVHEASVVRDYCQRLTQDREHKICVIAPYKAQVRAIRELLGPADLSDVSVGSVEQFQGQERKVIIFATTRPTNSEVDRRRALGFLQNRQRMNVAITRAQALLIVVGDPEVLGKDELWRTFLNYAYLRGGWRGKMLTWKPKEDVHVPGYKVIPRPEGVVYGESYVDGKSEKIYRYSLKLGEAGSKAGISVDEPSRYLGPAQVVAPRLRAYHLYTLRSGVPLTFPVLSIPSGKYVVSLTLYFE